MWTWWFWLGDRVDKESITADLEALKAQGIGGVTIYSLSGPGVTEQGPRYMGPEWRALFRHTVQEAHRLGLGVSSMLCSGWNTGGPWVTPELACKRHVHAETVLVGPTHFKGPLPQPPADKRFYRDVAIQAYPLKPGWSRPVITASSSYKTLDDSYGDSAATPIREVCEAPLRPLAPVNPAMALDPAGMIDLAPRCSREGVLDWQVPEGRWLVVRTGCTLTGDVTKWSSPTGVGLEADPLDAAAMELQFAKIAQPLIEDAGPLAGRVFRSVQVDSWEIGLPNWTTDFIERFRKLRGYDPRPYLPALAGQVVGSSQLTDRFLYDYRRTVADCVAESCFGRLSRLAESRGIVQQSEAGGVCYPKVAALDALANLGRCAIPMGEFWQDGAWVEAGQNKNGKQTASAAHVYGRRIAAAEAFTSFIHWVDSPATLKPTADRAFCEGFNHFFIFSSATHSGDGMPGTEFCAGTHFNRKITWWNQARPWADYVARCSHMLQQGRFVADVLYYNGDGCPNFVGPKHVDPALGPGYDYDVCNTEVLLSRLAVRDGRIVLPDGMSYRLLVLPDRRDMPVEVLRKLKDLVAEGMTLVGPRPERDPGLRGFPASDRQVQQLAAELWGDCDGKKVQEHVFGKGRVAWGLAPREIFARAGVVPDFRPLAAGSRPDAFVDWIHRSAEGAEIYFLANRRGRPENVMCTFRVAGKQPELWDPVSGQVRDAAAFWPCAGCQTMVPLELEPYGSMFVVFRRPASRDAFGREATNYPALRAIQELTGPWTVSFDPQRGGPRVGRVPQAGRLDEAAGKRGKVLFGHGHLPTGLRHAPIDAIAGHASVPRPGRGAKPGRGPGERQESRDRLDRPVAPGDHRRHQAGGKRAPDRSDEPLAEPADRRRGAAACETPHAHQHPLPAGPAAVALGPLGTCAIDGGRLRDAGARVLTAHSPAWQVQPRRGALWQPGAKPWERGQTHTP